MGMDFLRILIVSFLDTRHSASLNSVSLFDQFVDTLRIGLFGPGQTFQVSRLPIRLPHGKDWWPRRICLGAVRGLQVHLQLRWDSPLYLLELRSALVHT